MGNNENFVKELRWRGMLQDITPGAEALLDKETVKGYIGFDPTADSLGVGNLVQVMTLLHFQRAGHKPVALVGGATGMVGDPSGKSQERNLLDEDALQHNLSCQKAQLEKFLDFNCGVNSAEIVNNYDWFRDMGFLNFIRDVGKHITVNYMLAKDSVQRRMETGLSFTEFSYQLIQGFDFYYLWKNLGVKLQMGGSDQWGNIVTGTELIRRKTGEEAYALTTPLIKKADGTKFGKTESGNIWLDPKRTSPYKFYQFWLNAADADISSYIKIFSLKGREEIAALELEHSSAPHLRLLQKTLADEITMRVHSEEALHQAKKASEVLFGKSTKETLSGLTINEILEIFEGVPQYTVPGDVLHNGVMLVDLLAVHTSVLPSKSEARKLIQSGGISINQEKVASADALVSSTDIVADKLILLRKGKKEYSLVIVD
jgi:tyrosyl-tRNA synthetase